MSRPGPILVYSTYSWDLPRFERLLGEALPEVEIHYAGSAEEAAPHLSRAEIFYGWGFSPELLRRMPRVRWVQKMGAGVDDIVDDWPFGTDVLLTRTDGRLIATRMAEYVIAAILDKCAGFDVARRQKEARIWAYYEVGSIRDMTIGVAGLGEIGAEIASALSVLGARVTGWRRAKADAAHVSRLFLGGAALPEFIAGCDAIVLVLPLTRETNRLFDDRVLGLCRPGAHIINVGRGAVVDEAALLAALESGRVGHATLDVFAEEPLPAAHPFWRHPRVTMTPHVGGPLIPERIAPHFIENYAAFARGRPMKHVIDLARQY